MKLEGNQFYVLDAGKDKWIFMKRSEAISQMKEIVKKGNAEKTKILSINTEAEKWEITQVGWQEIAMELIKEQG